jgi:hypothetical protein
MSQSYIALKPKSMRLNATREGSTISRVYTMFGWLNEIEAAVAFRNFLEGEGGLTLVAPITGAIAQLDTFDLQQIGDDFIHNPGESDGPTNLDPPAYGTERGSGVFEVSVSWSTFVGKAASVNSEADLSYSVAIDNKSKHIDFSLSTEQRINVEIQTASSGLDLNGAIGVIKGKDGKLDIKGTDVPGPPDLTYTVERRYKLGSVSRSDMKNIATLKNSICDSSQLPLGLFHGFAYGEIIFLGSEMKFDPNSTETVVNYSFAVSANDLDFRPLGYVPDEDEEIPTIIKYGWDYFWTGYAEEDEEIQQGIPLAPVTLPVLVATDWYIERVMPFKKWNTLITLMNKD